MNTYRIDRLAFDAGAGLKGPVHVRGHMGALVVVDGTGDVEDLRLLVRPVRQVLNIPVDVAVTENRRLLTLIMMLIVVWNVQVGE